MLLMKLGKDDVYEFVVNPCVCYVPVLLMLGHFLLLVEFLTLEFVHLGSKLYDILA